ncbi:hypothetical protein MZK49_09985 [Ensifer sesbaniae]|uniref:hypothetical protein n=1 Tax=Ensifer sesbaniae TaxID=1214071 RepID=UPI001568B10B|nr:hypothetical protein [Ensifer sesbaniae]MCK3777065.1 hypothetical protein [Ensifer sesbaniae]
MLALALAMIWPGLRAFGNPPLKIASALFGPILWIAVTYFSDFFRESVTMLPEPGHRAPQRTACTARCSAVYTAAK